MAFTKFGDIKFDPDMFMEYMEEFSPEPAAFIASGILTPDNSLTGQMNAGGNYVTVPFFKPLSGASQNYDGSDITVNAIASGSQSAIVIGRSNAWGSQDLAAELASKDPIKAIAGKIATYWREEKQSILIKTLVGMFAAAGFSTHIHDYSIADGDNALDANLMGSDIIIDAAQGTLGDRGGKIVAMAVHSTVYARLQKLNLITLVPLSDQTTMVPYFLDKVVIVDDACPKVAGGTSGFVYSSFLFAKGVIAQASGKVKVPVETGRDKLLDGGREYIVNRDRFIYHPYGANFTKASLATISPTDAELVTGTNWTKVYADKNIAIILVKTNG